ncbi:hypothetical protein HY085_02560, partial [Candidatus Gottesmanbacteria bacterium]|nr:hypothetical protein [Candidatus Gottesmanbacteria bacterium]
NLGKLDKKTAEKLAQGTEMAGLSKKLAQIKTDVPLQFDLEKASTEKINWPEGAKFMREKLGFKSLADKIQKSKFKSQNCAQAQKSEQLGLI